MIPLHFSFKANLNFLERRCDKRLLLFPLASDWSKTIDPFYLLVLQRSGTQALGLRLRLF